MASVLLPSFILMIAIAALYGKYSNLEPVNNFLSGVIPVIIALILSLCYNMVVKHVSKPWQYITMLLIIVAAFYLNSYQAIILYILTGAVLGYVFSRKDESNQITEPASIDKYKRLYLYSGLVVVVLIFLVLYFVLNGIHHQLLFEFGKVSLTLFGGGYVMIPILHEIVVDNFNWLSSSEFANAIAFGQVTPGPILVSATYVGYKLGGIMGAFLATMGIFVPSAVVMIIVGNVFERVKTYAVMDGIMKGVRPVIIALIAYSGWILFDSLDQKLFSLIITIASFLIITYTKFNYFLVILIAGIIGLLIF
jgi:chromate transporter